MIHKIKFIIRHFIDDSLYRNSFYIMLSTAVMAFFGFFFWIINAKLYTPEQIGIATTLLSVVALISNICLLGFNNGLIRYLPNAKNKNEIINTALVLVTITSLILGLFYIFFVNMFSPVLIFIREQLLLGIVFLVFIAFTTIATVSESIFISFRNAKFILIRNSVLSIIKLVLPLLLVGFGAYGIFFSVGIATIVSLIISFIYLTLRYEYVLKPIISGKLVKLMFKFSLGNYVAGLIAGLPATLLPILITNNLGPKFTAFYYMPMMIASLLYIIPQAITRSLFAEGSHDENDLDKMYKKSLKLNILLYVPSMLIAILLGKYVLLAFGAEYADNGTQFLQLLAVSGIFISINSIIGTILNIKQKLMEIIYINIVTVTIILVLSYLFAQMALVGIGLAFLIGQIVMSIIYIIFYIKYK